MRRVQFGWKVCRWSLLPGVILAGVLVGAAPTKILAAPIRIPIEGGTVPIGRDFALRTVPRAGSTLEVGLVQLGNASFAPGSSVEIFASGHRLTTLTYPGTSTAAPTTTASLDLNSLRDLSTGVLPPLTIRAASGGTLLSPDFILKDAPIEVAPERLPSPAPGAPAVPRGPSSGPGSGAPPARMSSTPPREGLVPCQDGPCQLQELMLLGANIFNWLLLIGGAAALLALIVAGTRYLTAVLQGADSRAIEEAKHSVTYALIGLVVLLAAVVIVRTIINTLGKGAFPTEFQEPGALVK